MTQACIFCGEVCYDRYEEKGEGVAGMRIGEQLICDRCLNELKRALGIEKLERLFQEPA